MTYDERKDGAPPRCPKCGKLELNIGEGPYLCKKCFDDIYLPPDSPALSDEFGPQPAPPREFDLYFVTDDDGTISPYDASICENREKWTPDSKWAEPTVHAIEFKAYAQAISERDRLAAEVERLTQGRPADVVNSFRKERDRYRAALEKIAHPDNIKRSVELVEIARDALRGGS